MDRRSIRRGLPLALSMLLASLWASPGAAASPSPGSDAPDDACWLLTEQEVLAASDAIGVIAQRPGPQLGLPAGCLWELQGPEGVETMELTYGFQATGGRERLDQETAITPGRPVAGVGDRATNLVGSVMAVRGDAMLALSHVVFGFGDVRPARLVARALAWRALQEAVPGPGAPSTGPICLLSPDELAEVTALPFQTVSATDDACAYQGSPRDRFALDLRLVDPDTGTATDDLAVARLDAGRDVTVRGYPAWLTKDGVSVDVGTRVLVVEPILFLDDVDADASDMALAVADLAAERLPPELAAPTPVPTPESDADLAARFPADVDGRALQVQSLTGADLAAQLEGADPVARERFDRFLAALEPIGKTLDDISLGAASLFDPATGAQGSIVAIRVRGADMAPLREETAAALSGLASPEMEPVVIGGVEALAISDPDRPGEVAHVVATGDVVWLVTAFRCATAVQSAGGCDAWETDLRRLGVILSAIGG